MNKIFVKFYPFSSLRFLSKMSSVARKSKPIFPEISNNGRSRNIENVSVSHNSKSDLESTLINALQCSNNKYPTRRPFRVSIEGNIGAGKSTLIKHFTQFQGVETYPEPIESWRNVDGNNLLDLLYSDIHKWSSIFEMNTMLSRLKTQTTKPKDTTLIQMFERSVQNNRFCFIEQSRRKGYLQEVCYSIIDEWYRWISDNIDVAIDLIVYLRTSPEVVFERIKARGRPEETGISLEFLTDLHDIHEEWLLTNNTNIGETQVLIINANHSLKDVIQQYETHETKILGLDRRIGLRRTRFRICRKS